MRPPAGGMILDRDLTPDLLDVALRIANADTCWADKRKLLTVALRDHVSVQEAQGKTKKCLTRVWVNPPSPAAGMIAWGRQHSQLASDRRLLHLGAVLATFPFAGSVAVVVGRALALDGQIAAVDVRNKIKAVWGDRSSVDIGARKAYTTFLRLGALTGGGSAPLTAGMTFEANSEMAAWLIHALMLTRCVTSINAAELAAAPELFWVTLARPDGGGYPLLERHNEGGRRVVWAVRPD
jgi:hypothetical protein